MQLKKTIVILIGKSNWDKERPFLKDIYRESYEYLINLSFKRGVKLVVCSYSWFSSEKGVFEKGWFFNGNEWLREYNIRPELIYDKLRVNEESHLFKKNISSNIPIVNDPDFTFLVNNKLYTSMLFPEYLKKCFLVADKLEAVEAAKKIKGKNAVLKPLVGSGGQGVVIIPKNEVKNDDLKVEEQLLCQEFIDSSDGIDGLTDGLHDLRLIFINDKLIYSYLRIPKEGALLANVSKGGTMEIVKKKDLPKSVYPLIKKIQKRFEVYSKKIYTIDIMFDQDQRPWIVELNTMPGLYFSPEQYYWRDKMYKKMIDLFKEYVG